MKIFPHLNFNKALLTSQAKTPSTKYQTESRPVYWVSVAAEEVPCSRRLWTSVCLAVQMSNSRSERNYRHQNPRVAAIFRRKVLNADQINLSNWAGSWVKGINHRFGEFHPECNVLRLLRLILLPTTPGSVWRASSISRHYYENAANDSPRKDQRQVLNVQ